MIHIINYGIGNLGSVLNMFKKVGAEAKLTSDPQEILRAQKLFLPGVGHFDACMKAFRTSGLQAAVEQKVLQENTPIMGICVGFQMMTKSSDEGQEQGLGWFDAHTLKFDFANLPLAEQGLKVPHMGWNYVKAEQNHALVEGLTDKARFYFVHSYKVMGSHPQEKLFTTKYGEIFDSALVKNNIAGFQFHAEKSHRYGMTLFRNFAGWQP